MSIKYMTRINRFSIGTLTTASLLLLAGCAPLIVGAGVGASAIISEDRRTSGAMLEDKTIEIKALKLIKNNLGENNSIKVHSFNRYTLLVGQVASEEKRIEAEDLTMEVSNVRQAQNEIEIAGEASSISKNNDGFIKARVLGNFVKDQDVKSQYFKIIVESGVVFLMGLVTQEEGKTASKVAANTTGVKKVITVFEYLD